MKQLVLLLGLCFAIGNAAQSLTWKEEMAAIGQLIHRVHEDALASGLFDNDEQAELKQEYRTACAQLKGFLEHPRNLNKARELATTFSEHNHELLAQHKIKPAVTSGRFSTYFLTGGIVSLMVMLGFAPIAQAAKPSTYHYTSCSANEFVITQEALNRGTDMHITACKASAALVVKNCAEVRVFPESSTLLAQNLCRVDAMEEYYQCLKTAYVKDFNGNIITLTLQE